MKEEDNTVRAITTRLDGMLRLLIESIKVSNPEFGNAEVAIALHSVGLSTTEIAKILGWKSHGSVGNLLKSKKAAKDDNSNIK